MKYRVFCSLDKCSCPNFQTSRQYICCRLISNLHSRMSGNRSEIDVCLECLENAETPWCAHGPTLLLERFSRKIGETEKFYACSACRDRKTCNFYQRYGEKISQESQKAHLQMLENSKPKLTHSEYYQRLSSFRKLPASERKMCVACGLLLISPGESKEHASHGNQKPVTEDALYSPTRLLLPLDSNKVNAQYLFSEKSLKFLVGMLKELNYGRVLCIGTPRIHEALLADKTGNSPTSLLMDIDHRLQQFYSPEQFCRYNMFNHHFFGGESSEEIFRKFLTDSPHCFCKLAVLMDPPFGGLVEVLAYNLRKIQNLWTDLGNSIDDLGIFWIFPYFMEPRILEHLSEFAMLDYKVDYENHAHFKAGGRSQKPKLQSPVRIFTNAKPSNITLPASEGYRFCSKCERFVAKENKHCSKCEACTSKNGKTYRHCDSCQRCVKPSYVHCDKCHHCHLPDHPCGLSAKTGCHICGELGHKRKECPNKAKIHRMRKKKRKAESSAKEEESGKRRKLSHSRKKKKVPTATLR